METLTVLYDARCPLCGWATSWLSAKAQLVQLDFVPAGSDRARSMFPDLDHEATLTDITVVADDGSMYCNEKAWVMCLWATVRYRHMADRLASPAMLPMTRRFVAFVSKYRPVDRECEDGNCHV